MGEYSKIELLLIDKFKETIDKFIQSAISSQSDKDKLMYKSCLNDEEKESFTKREARKMQKKLTKCSPDIAEFLRCYISPSDFDLSGDNYDQYRERLIKNFLYQEFNDVLEVLIMRFKNIEDVETLDVLEWEEMIEESYYGIDNKFISHFVKYMAIADRLTTFKSILESVEEEKAKKEISKEPDQLKMINNRFEYDDFKDSLLVEELEKRVAIEAVEYKKNCDDYWETYKFDPTYFDTFISGELYNVFLNAIYERIKPLNGFEINKYLTLSVNQFKTHTPTKRAETFKRIYHDTYWYPNHMEYNPNQYENKYPVYVWKHYTNHFQLFKEASENVLQDFKNGLIGNVPEQEVIEKPKNKIKLKQKSFTYKKLKFEYPNLTYLKESLINKNLIAPDTELKYFRKIFSGEAIDKPIVWTGNISELSYFIKQLHNKLEYVENVKQEIWSITINCFIQENGEQYNRTKLRTQKVPATSKNIDSALNTLK
jgi:hypothetical protein